MLVSRTQEENIAGQIYTETRKIRLMVVDDHEIVRKGLVMVLAMEPDMEMCGEARNGLEAVEMAQRLDPDLVLMDLKIPGLNGIEAARTIKNHRPECKILILSGVDASAAVLEALQSGIDGYLLKEVTTEELAYAVRRVAAGENYLHPGVARKMLSKNLDNPLPALPDNKIEEDSVLKAREATPLSYSSFRQYKTSSGMGESLSEREREVLRSVALGQSNREIAEALVVSEETIRTHLKSTFRKLGVNDRTHAVVLALKQGLIEL